MTISEKKMQIVIDNYFKSECDVNTSIRQAFEKGFRIGVKKGQFAEPERKKGKWIHVCDGYTDYVKCDRCGRTQYFLTDFCAGCGTDMREGEQE